MWLYSMYIFIIRKYTQSRKPPNICHVSVSTAFYSSVNSDNIVTKDFIAKVIINKFLMVVLRLSNNLISFVLCVFLPQCAPAVTTVNIVESPWVATKCTALKYKKMDVYVLFVVYIFKRFIAQCSDSLDFPCYIPVLWNTHVSCFAFFNKWQHKTWKAFYTEICSHNFTRWKWDFFHNGNVLDTFVLALLHI